MAAGGELGFRRLCLLEARGKEREQEESDEGNQWVYFVRWEVAGGKLSTERRRRQRWSW
jgi:hypothetical protein